MGKLLSIAIPCYNSEAYMRHAIESLLPGGKDVEILIVDDGSRDGTSAIADEYAQRYPEVVRALHKENGGHGDAVMCGLEHAEGLYFKVVDSDDWVDEQTYPRVLSVLREMSEKEKQVDLVICDYVYDKVGANHKRVIRYTNCLPINRRFTWNDVGRFHVGQYILMHSAIYRTQVLHDSGIHLPKHTFYVDNLYVYVPLPQVRTMYYLDEVFYHYFIGRDDQSVHEEVMIRRIDQQLRVNRMMAEAVDLGRIEPKAKQEYMRNYLEIITAVSTVMLLRSGTKENLEKKEALWNWLKKERPEIYSVLRKRALGRFLHLPGRLGRRLICSVYALAQRIYGFN